MVFSAAEKELIKTRYVEKGLIWTKVDTNIPLNVLFKICSQNMIPSKTLVAMITKWNFLDFFFLKNHLLWNRWSDFGPILKTVDRNVPYVILFKNCSQNMAPVNGDFMHYTKMKNFLKKIFSETAGQVLK